MLIGMAGNANTGKTTLFNSLTGANGHIGNFPGVTVEYQRGQIKKSPHVELMDLPGIYSLTPYSEEEQITKEALQGVDCILNVIDGSHLARHLYLTLQLTELGVPMVVAVNMVDELKEITIDFSLLSSFLGILVIPVSARKKKGLEELIKGCTQQTKPPPCPVFPRMGESYLQLAQRRYDWIDWVCSQCVYQKKQKTSSFADRILLYSPLAIPLMIGVMAGLLFLPFGPPGQWTNSLITQALDRCFDCLPGSLFPWLDSMVRDGILKGMGSVLSFFPSVFLLFFGVSLLEDSGYLARISFLADKPFQSVGLSGRCVLPLLTGFGCTVPAVSSLKMLPSGRDKLLTLLFLPFVSCSAKLPVYTLITGAVFPRFQFVIVFLLYVSAMAWGMINSAFSHRFLVKEGSDSFVMELPPYRLPRLTQCVRYGMVRTGEFLKKTVTLIFLSGLIIWALQYFTPRITPALEPKESILMQIAIPIAPLFSPLGFGTAEMTASLLAGLGAKEAIVSTLSILSNHSWELSPLSAFSFLHFVLLYSPCVAAFSAVRKELGTLSALLVFFYQTALAWLISFGIYQIGTEILSISVNLFLS